MIEQLPLLNQQLKKVSLIAANQPNNKNFAYQHKILELLVREKTTDAKNKDLASTITSLQDDLKKIRQQRQDILIQKDRDIAALKQSQDSFKQQIQQLQMEVKLAKMGKIETEEENEEIKCQLKKVEQELLFSNRQREVLGQEIKRNSEVSDKLKANLSSQIAISKAEGEKLSKSQQMLQNLQMRYGQSQDSLRITTKQCIQAKNHIQQLAEEIQRLNKQLTQRIGYLEKIKSEYTANTLALKQAREESERTDQKIRELSKENNLLRDKKNSTERELEVTESAKENFQSILKKIEKENKKLKEQLKESVSKEKDAEEELSKIADKNRSLQRQLKVNRKEIEELKEQLIIMEQSSGNEVAKMRKWESGSKAQRQKIAELQQLLQLANEDRKTIKNQLQLTEKAKFQLSMQLEKVTKEKQILSELNMQLEERKVLMDSERDKAITTLVKEKDVLNRANFKLLQLLELKDKAIKVIVDSVQKDQPTFEISTLLEGQQVIRDLISTQTKNRLLDGRQRVKFLTDWLRQKEKQ